MRAKHQGMVNPGTMLLVGEASGSQLGEKNFLEALPQNRGVPVPSRPHSLIEDEATIRQIAALVDTPGISYGGGPAGCRMRPGNSPSERAINRGPVTPA